MYRFEKIKSILIAILLKLSGELIMKLKGVRVFLGYKSMASCLPQVFDNSLRLICLTIKTLNAPVIPANAVKLVLVENN